MPSPFQEWFLANRPVVIFIYGQVFFVAGLAIILQSRRYSRLQLAQSLPWLAAFCIIHSFNEWGDIFIPIQGQSSTDLVRILMKVIQLGLLGSSFACLLRFGIGMLRPFTGRWTWLRWIPLFLFLIWMIGPYWFGFTSTLPENIWENIANATARYSMGFTGAAISAIALFRYSTRIPTLSRKPNIHRYLRFTALSLGLYAIFGGLIVPPAPFFPANIVNTNTFMQIFFVPPMVFRSLAGLLLAYSMIRALEIFELETDQLIVKMEQSQVIALESERIGRDLHDGALQKVYSAGLQAQSMRKHAHGRQAADMENLVQTLNNAITELRVFLVKLRPAETNADLKNALQAIIEDTSQASEIEIEFSSVSDLLLPPEKVVHLVAVVREALSNVLRHSNATHVKIGCLIDDTVLHLEISDNGVGMPATIDPGFGLRNIRERVNLLEGNIKLSTPEGGGTCISLEIPLGEMLWV